MASRFLFSFPRTGSVPNPAHEHFVRDVFEPFAKRVFATYLRRVGPKAAFDDPAATSGSSALEWAPHPDIEPIAYLVQRIVDDYRRSASGMPDLQMTATKYGYWIAQSALQTELLTQVTDAVLGGQDALLTPGAALSSYRTAMRFFVHRLLRGHAGLQQDIIRLAWKAVPHSPTAPDERQELGMCCELLRGIPYASITYQDVAQNIHEYRELCHAKSRIRALLLSEVKSLMRAMHENGFGRAVDNDDGTVTFHRRHWSKLSARARGHLQDKGVPIFLFGAEWAPLRDMIPLPRTVLRQSIGCTQSSASEARRGVLVDGAGREPRESERGATDIVPAQDTALHDTPMASSCREPPVGAQSPQPWRRPRSGSQPRAPRSYGARRALMAPLALAGGRPAQHSHPTADEIGGPRAFVANRGVVPIQFGKDAAGAMKRAYIAAIGRWGAFANRKHSLPPMAKPQKVRTECWATGARADTWEARCRCACRPGCTGMWRGRLLALAGQDAGELSIVSPPCRAPAPASIARAPGVGSGRACRRPTHARQRARPGRWKCCDAAPPAKAAAAARGDGRPRALPALMRWPSAAARGR